MWVLYRKNVLLLSISNKTDQNPKRDKSKPRLYKLIIHNIDILSYN